MKPDARVPIYQTKVSTIPSSHSAGYDELSVAGVVERDPDADIDSTKVAIDTKV
jgi:hypothetical protein